MLSAKAEAVGSVARDSRKIAHASAMLLVTVADGISSAPAGRPRITQDALNKLSFNASTSAFVNLPNIWLIVTEPALASGTVTTGQFSLR